MEASPSNTIALTGIVLEPVSGDNYQDWSTLVENYLAGQALWDDVVAASSEAARDNPDWKSKNAKALHVIQLSCGSRTLPYIRKCETAKEAWKILKALFGSEELRASEHTKDIELGPPTSSEKNIQDLRNALKNGLWNEAKSIIDSDRDILFHTSSAGRTVLHDAVIAGHEVTVHELVKLGNQPLLTMKDERGYTALALVAQFSKNVEIAELMIRNRGTELLAEENCEGEIPVLIASAEQHEEMTRCLFHHTPWSVLINENNQFRYAFVFLERCIYAQIFDIAVMLIKRQEAKHFDLHKSYCALASIPSAFRSGIHLSWTQQFIYNNLLMQRIKVNFEDKNIEIEPRGGSQEETNAYVLIGATRDHSSLPMRCFGGIFRQVQQFIKPSILLKFFGIWETYEMKKKHSLVLVILHDLCLRTKSSKQYEWAAGEAMLLAAKNGIIEFIDSMRNVNSDLLLIIDDNGRGLLAHAILNRKKKMFEFMLGVKNYKEIFASYYDKFGNNILHLTAELGISSTSGGKYSTTLHLLRELQWFKAVKSIVPRACYESKNEMGLTPCVLFTMNHAELVEDSKQWLKETSNTGTTFGTVIITLMFAAAITVPGGNDQNKGTPMFLGKEAFTLFAVADAISLITSLSSVLAFLAILTSSFAEEDFMKSLPLKLFFGFGFLLLSVLSMVCAFYAALISMLNGYRWILVAALCITVIPTSLFIPSILRRSTRILRFAIISGFHSIKNIKSH
ncbi:uncharacterized protein LOC113868172 [Abrus precatorius]|uniref:Uncharacterized protein LOC113868172 n=1 Tax=Abrus precatorius TaxID=3816 RepID=A0A8B8LTE6_ABRPR|nr:uncharacterized protein LOC113868172 [Abrus precatorius]